jgi:peptidyl-tRNA hydrolase, PTH1 family
MLIVGLGNPGLEYQNTRHNAGFMAVDLISNRLNFSFSNSTKFKCLISTGIYQNKKLVIIKPLTYMNLSGESVSLIKNYYNIESEDIFVFHDEIDLPISSVKMKIGGSHAGHNGLKSIDKHIGQNYYRIRIGVGRPENGQDVASYVLGKFSKEERNHIDKITELLSDKLDEILSKQFKNI